MYSNTGLGVAKSENGGTTWVDQVDGMTAVQTFDIAQANDKNIVWIGANGGLAKTTNFTDTVPTWEYPILPDVGISSVQAVWVKPNNGNYVVAGLSDYISISTNGGATWNHASTPAFFGRIEEIVPSSVDSQTLYAVYTNTSLIDDYYNGGVLKSIDSGVNWTELNFPTTLASSALAVATNDGHDVLYVGIGSGGNETGVYTYNGTNWEKLDEDFNGLYVNNILVQPEDNNIIFVSCEAASTIGSLFKSTDAGATWMVITAGLTDANHLGAMAVQSDKNDTMYLAGQESSSNQGLIYKSTDGGESWSTYYTGLKQEFYYALQFDGLISGNDRGLFSLKSLGKITLKSYRQNGQATLRITLRDAATRDVLSDRSLKIYRKVSGQTWKIIKRATTNKRGRIVVRAAAAKKTKFKVIWQPQSADQAEYTKTTSRLLTID
ncbi:MAG: hypothetical protein ACD_43C00142G0005 [uncultured bacterium]|nr:MAG: hypothetical protein ACD_43C00142G0005 [uncultured bacterium]